MNIVIVHDTEKLGYDRLKRQNTFVSGHDILIFLWCCQLARYGKISCFTMLLPVPVYDALRGNSASASVVLCISPLVSLMIDQKM